MKYLRYWILVILLAIASSAPRADWFVHEDKNWVHLSAERRCDDQRMLKQIPEQFRELALFGAASINGKQYPLCWIRTPTNNAFLIYPDGDQGVLPLAIFTESPNI